MFSPCTNGADTGVSVLFFARGAAYVPEVHAVARESLLNSILADDVVGEAGNVADVVAGPFADGIYFEDRPGVSDRVWHFAYADLSIPLSYLHTPFGRAVAALHYAAVAVGFVEEDFIPGPVDDSIGWGCLGEAVGCFVGEQWGRGSQQEESRV